MIKPAQILDIHTFALELFYLSLVLVNSKHASNIVNNHFHLNLREETVCILYIYGMYALDINHPCKIKSQESKPGIRTDIPLLLTFSTTSVCQRLLEAHNSNCKKPNI